MRSLLASMPTTQLSGELRQASASSPDRLQQVVDHDGLEDVEFQWPLLRRQDGREVSDHLRGGPSSWPRTVSWSPSRHDQKTGSVSGRRISPIAQRGPDASNLAEVARDLVQGAGRRASDRRTSRVVASSAAITSTCSRRREQVARDAGGHALRTALPEPGVRVRPWPTAVPPCASWAGAAGRMRHGRFVRDLGRVRGELPHLSVSRCTSCRSVRPNCIMSLNSTALPCSACSGRRVELHQDQPGGVVLDSCNVHHRREHVSFDNCPMFT